jgi:hypothetical protein
MKNWIQKNLKSIIATAFVIPILLVAFVSISHVTSFYGITNPFAWAIYLSVAVEIAALSALAGVSVKMGRFIYFPFILVTFIQFVGNLFFSYSYIQETSETFKQWMEMAGPLFEPMGIDPTNIPTHKLILALFSGGLLPIISLTFAHMLVVYSNKETITETATELTEEQIDEISRKAGIIEREVNTITPAITIETIEKLEKHLDVIQKEKFGEEEKVKDIVVEDEVVEEIVEPTVEEIHEEHTEEIVEPTVEEIHEEHTEEIVVENQNLDELKDQLSNDTNIKRLSYSKRDV